jgi:hypothetical protein
MINKCLNEEILRISGKMQAVANKIGSMQRMMHETQTTDRKSAIFLYNHTADCNFARDQPPLNNLLRKCPVQACRRLTNSSRKLSLGSKIPLSTCIHTRHTMPNHSILNKISRLDSSNSLHSIISS